MSRLNALVAPAAPAPPTAADIAARWAAVEEARGAARQAAIHRLMETVSSLPPDEQIDHVQRLNRLAAAEGPAR
jgi:hypothetical protein